MSLKNRYIGKSVTKVDALTRVTGQAVFAADIKVPNVLHAKVVRSPHPHARIKSIDVNQAAALYGVKAVVTSADLPELDESNLAFGGELFIDLRHLRKLVVAHDKVLFQGHAVAAIAATTPEVAEEAARLIDVDYELLNPVTDAISAMAEGTSLLHDDLITQTIGDEAKNPSNIASIVETGYGDVEDGLKKSDYVLETSYQTQMVHQGYLEPMACTAHAEHDGSVTVWTSTQGTFHAQKQLSAILKIPMRKLNVVPMEVGGAFGGKIYALLEPLAIMLSQRSGRPVRIVMSREEVLKATGPSSPSYITIKTGVREDGHLRACYAKMVYDAGAFPGAPVQAAAMIGFGAYKADNVKSLGYDVVTNKPRVQAYRAPGGTAVAFAVESHMDAVAKSVNIDPLQFRKINSVSEGDLMPNGNRYNRIGLSKMIDAIEKHPSWTTSLSGNNVGRGIAFGFWGGASMTSSSELLVNVDGSVSVVTGQVDLTGIRTTMMQIVAHELEIPLDFVTVKVADTGSSLYTDGSFGSRSTYTQSAALHKACQEVMRQMKQLATTRLKVQSTDVLYKEGAFYDKSNRDNIVTWEDVAILSRGRGEAGPISAQGVVTNLQPAPAFAAHVADVEVDVSTGKIHILRYTCFQDVGRAVNPMQVEGQMQGGAVQGIGWALSEEYYWDKGILLNPSMLDYRMPTSLDVPMIDTVIVEEPATDGPYGVRGVAEVPIMPPPAAIGNAVFDAIGIRLSCLPMTPERVFWAYKTGK